ncbi:MAG: hypothetical protein ACOYKJ_06675 [Candidatus Howiella sp.]|jgi:hypothetical protein
MMKTKYTAAVFFLLLIGGILCSCTAAEDILLQTAGYTGACRVTGGGSTYTIAVAVGEGGNFSCEITEPVNLVGFRVSYVGEECLIAFGDMEWSGSAEDLPASSPVAALRNAFIAAGRSAQTPTKCTNGLYMLEGECGSGAYKFTFDGEGRPHALTIDALDLQAEFS